jgi:hypothetical protein
MAWNITQMLIQLIEDSWMVHGHSVEDIKGYLRNSAGLKDYELVFLLAYADDYCSHTPKPDRQGRMEYLAERRYSGKLLGD